jgi:EAL domain-containing protein (putative c-di-GMP-specific phosphodiesterase class I)
MGVARYPENARDAADLLKKADIALYSAKQSSPGTAMNYSPIMAEFFERHDRAMELVGNALTDRSLVPYYQQKIRLSDGVRTGFEALARIEGSSGVIGPVHFAPAFSDRLTARRIGRRMLKEVICDVASWLAAGFEPGSVSVNVSEFDFADGKFVGRFLDLLGEHGVPPSRVTIEVTESVFLGEKAALAKAALKALDEHGVMIELDDFGTGYASLTHLRSMPVSRLKIDRSFVHDIDKDSGNRSIVKAVIELGHNLNCEIVAEGVETAAQADLLREMGCDIGQGFLFGYPESAAEVARVLVEEAADNARQLSTLARSTRTCQQSDLDKAAS